MKGPSVIAIDPGTTESGWVRYENHCVTGAGVKPNPELLEWLDSDYVVQTSMMAGTELAIEMVASYGMAVGKEVFETVRWIGRFQQVWFEPEAVRLVYRKEVKLHLCGDLRAKDSNIRAALIDKFGPGREKAIGVKKNPGPLYGVTSHAWAALAVAVTAGDTK